MSELDTDTAAFMSRLAEAKRANTPERVCHEIPYTRFMGMSLENHAGEVLGHMAFTDMLIGNPTLPALHGGTLGSLLETTGLLTLMWEVELAAAPKTINLTVQYLRSGQPVDVWAKATLTRHGRRVANVHVAAWQEDRARPVATANLHALIQPA